MRPASKHRLFVDADLTVGRAAIISGERAHYLKNVLRLKAQDDVVLFNGQGGEYSAIVLGVSKQRVELVVEEFHADDYVSAQPVLLLQAVMRGERMDWLVQKATELGVSAIQPVEMERSVVRLKAARAEQRRVHWQGVARSACEQCGRNRVPTIRPPAPLAKVVAGLEAGARFVLDPLAGASWHDVQLTAPAAVTLLVGPEGGITADELALATRHGFQPIRMGPRVLRAETAGIAALTAVQLLAGDLG